MSRIVWEKSRFSRVVVADKVNSASRNCQNLYKGFPRANGFKRHIIKDFHKIVKLDPEIVKKMIENDLAQSKISNKTIEDYLNNNYLNNDLVRGDIVDVIYGNDYDSFSYRTIYDGCKFIHMNDDFTIPIQMRILEDKVPINYWKGQYLLTLNLIPFKDQLKDYDKIRFKLIAGADLKIPINSNGKEYTFKITPEADMYEKLAKLVGDSVIVVDNGDYFIID